MKRILLFIALVLSLCSISFGQIPSTLGWYEIPNTKLRSLCPGTQCQNIVAAWSGGVMDTARNRMIIWGGGHNDYFGNEVYAVNLNGTPNVERLTVGCFSGGAFDEVCAGSNPEQPQSRHTYGFIQYMANVDKMWTWSRAWNNWAPGWMFNFANLSWSKNLASNTAPGNMPYTTNTFASAYDPNSGKVFITDLGSLYTFNPLTGGYVNVGSSSGGVVTDALSMVIDPVRKKAFTFGGSESGVYDISGTGSYNRQAFVTTGGAAIVNGTSPGLAYADGQIVGWSGGDTAYVLNVDTGVWSPMTYPGGPGPAQANGTFGRWQYSAPLGVFVLLNSIDQNAFSFRLGAGGPPPPPPPPPPVDITPPTVTITSPINGAIVSASITVTATATDNVGVVSFQFAMDGVVFGGMAQHPFDTRTIPDGMHTLSATASDAAGNVGSSSITITVQNAAQPSTRKVGIGKPYATVCAAINSAQPQDTIEIDAGIYPNESCLVTQAGLNIHSIGGKAHLKWGTGDSLTNTTLIPNGKGILVISGPGVVVDGLEFSGAKVSDQNGAGIRYEAGSLTVRNSYFHGNENGIMGQGGPTDTLLMENNVLDQNGFCGSGGCGHNVYIGSMGKLIFHYNRSTDSRNGSHPLKSRALVNEVTYNFLSTKNSDGSYEAEFPNGGDVKFIGNVIEQGAATSNSTIVSWGAEGATNPSPALYVINNTFNNLRTSGASFIQINGTPTLSIKNNIFIGVGTPLVGGTTDLTSNKALPLTDFVNAATGNYHLITGSAAIDAGVNPGLAGTYNLSPTFEYVDPADKIARVVAGPLDDGAYENGTLSNPCISDPLTITGVKWPAAQTGSRSITYNSGTKKVTSVLFQWPGMLTVTDDRNCTSTVVKP